MIMTIEYPLGRVYPVRMKRRHGVHDTAQKARATLTALFKEGAQMGQLGNHPLRWYNNPKYVPVPKAILLDALETHWPDAVFGIVVHDPAIYEIHWQGTPTVKDVREFLDSTEMIPEKLTVILSHQDLLEINS